MCATFADQLEPAQDLRVVLVGRTGLESMLHRDARIELLRVRQSLEAIGELGMPIDEESPRRCVVVLGADPVQGADMHSLTTALRRIDGEVRIVGVGHWEGVDGVRVGTSTEIGLDAWVRSDIVGDDLRGLFAPKQNGTLGSFDDAGGALRLDSDEDDIDDALGEIQIASPARESSADEVVVQQVTPAAGGTDELARGVVREPEPVQAPAPEVRSEKIGGTAREPTLSTWTALEASDELGILSTMIAGGDVLPACLTRLRRRLAPNHVEFHAVPSVGEHAPPRVGERDSVSDVHFKARVFGWLSGPTELKKDLDALGEWLAHCLALQEQRTQLRIAAFTDPLTGAWNRRYFDGFMTTSLEQARERRNSLTLLLFDVDNFKTYNDRFGHEAGDQILRQSVRLMRSVIRPTDRVCRVGGDEFAVIFYEPDGPRESGSRHPESLLGVVRRFQEQITKAKFPALGDAAPGNLTISGGLATFPWDGLTAEDLIRRADKLVLESKRLGKNKISIGSGGGDMESAP